MEWLFEVDVVSGSISESLNRKHSLQSLDCDIFIES